MMKKILLFGLALGMAFTGYSQKVAKSTKGLADVRTEQNRSDFSFANQNYEAQPRNIEMNSGKSVLLDRYELGKSGNIYSVLTSYQRCMAYDEASNTILGTFRADPATYAGALGTGTIMSHTSNDMGQTWAHQITLNPDPNVHALRYPSGVIYNPDGNANIEDAFTVVAGPAHTAGTWDYTYYGSAQLNNTNFNDYYNPWNDDNDWARSSMTVVPDAIYNFGQDYETVGNLGLNQTLKQYVGTTDDATSGFTWEINSVTPDWKIDPSDGHSIALYTNWSAWSKDGSIGYMWMIGVSNDSYDYGVYQPQIFYTEDAGNSWDPIELNLEDNPTLVDFLPPYQDGNGVDQTVRPTFLTGDRTYPGVVDYQGQLHLFSNVFGSSKGDVLDPDNGYWVVGDIQGGHIFDFVIDPTGVQNVIFIDSIMTKETAADAFGDVGWDHRLQASKSLDEKTVFAVWTDDIDSDDATVKNPDIYAWGYDVENNYVYESQNFTQDDLYAGFYFFPYVSEYTPLVNGFFNIPISTTLTPSEFSANDPLAPCTHTFVSGIGFQSYVGINDGLTSNSGNISVSQNIPNPFTGETSIEVTTNTAAPVMVEVSNIMGQTVYTVNAGTINGTKNIQLNSENLESGVYFYTVTVGNESMTKKMIVK
jgi:hypothetical protein